MVYLIDDGDGLATASRSKVSLTQGQSQQGRAQSAITKLKTTWFFPSNWDQADESEFPRSYLTQDWRKTWIETSGMPKNAEPVIYFQG